MFIKTTVADAIRYRPGMVSDASSEDGLTKTTTTSPVTYDVIYDENDDDGEDEEDGIEADRVVPVSDTAPCVSCAARLNLARCMFRTSRHAEVRKHDIGCTVDRVFISSHIRPVFSDPWSQNTAAA